MNPKKSVKPSRRITSNAYRTVPIEDETAGKLFRVRCKDWENLWGENLPYKEANTLKEQIATRGKSRTVRIEDMTIPPPDWYLEQAGDERDVVSPIATGNIVPGNLAALRGGAVTVATEAAKAAQQRHEKRVPVTLTKPRPVPVVKTELAGDDDMGIDSSDLSDMMATAGAQPSDSDVSNARAASARDVAEIEDKAKALYEQACSKLETPPGGHPEWSKLGKASQAGWKFTASDPNTPDPRNVKLWADAGAGIELDQIPDEAADDQASA